MNSLDIIDIGMFYSQECKSVGSYGMILNGKLNYPFNLLAKARVTWSLHVTQCGPITNLKLRYRLIILITHFLEFKYWKFKIFQGKVWMENSGRPGFIIQFGLMTWPELEFIMAFHSSRTFIIKALGTVLFNTWITKETIIAVIIVSYYHSFFNRFPSSSRIWIKLTVNEINCNTKKSSKTVIYPLLLWLHYIDNLITFVYFNRFFIFMPILPTTKTPTGMVMICCFYRILLFYYLFLSTG